MRGIEATEREVRRRILKTKEKEVTCDHRHQNKGTFDEKG